MPRSGKQGRVRISLEQAEMGGKGRRGGDGQQGRAGCSVLICLYLSHSDTLLCCGCYLACRQGYTSIQAQGICNSPSFSTKHVPEYLSIQGFVSTLQVLHLTPTAKHFHSLTHAHGLATCACKAVFQCVLHSAGLDNCSSCCTNIPTTARRVGV